MSQPVILQPALPSELRGVPFGAVLVHGADARDFLQRITTNDLSALTSGMVEQTLVVSDKGRIIDSIWVTPRGNGLLMLTAHRTTDTVTTFLERYIIMDDVVLSPAPPQLMVDLSFQLGSDGFNGQYYGIPARFIITEREGRPADQWPEEFERWRIINGIPAAGMELVQEFNPLELNLWPLISFTKGCYIGQEVIARLETYRKIQRNLCLFTADGAVTSGAVVHDEGNTVIGKVTSTFGEGDRSIGLCVINARSAAVGKELACSDGRQLRVHTVFQKEGYGRT